MARAGLRLDGGTRGGGLADSPRYPGRLVTYPKALPALLTQPRPRTPGEAEGIASPGVPHAFAPQPALHRTPTSPGTSAPDHPPPPAGPTARGIGVSRLPVSRDRGGGQGSLPAGVLQPSPLFPLPKPNLGAHRVGLVSFSCPSSTRSRAPQRSPLCLPLCLPLYPGLVPPPQDRAGSSRMGEKNPRMTQGPGRRANLERTWAKSWQMETLDPSPATSFMWPCPHPRAHLCADWPAWMTRFSGAGLLTSSNAPRPVLAPSSTGSRGRWQS